MPTRRLFGFAATAALLLGSLGPALAQETIRQWQFAASDDGLALELVEAPMPVAGPNEVLVRIHANSLNRRDLLMLNNQYGPGGSSTGGIPLSDGAGEVIAVGPGVTRFAVGDRVAGIFFADWIDGERDAAKLASARGGGPTGMLAEVVVSHEESLVGIPDHLTYEQAATLPCAGVTAWVVLFEQGNLQPDEYVLLEGTGGVSSLGLVFAAAAGARPIITSSSDEKLEQARTLGAFGTVNYRANENWQDEVRALTGGAGVDHVLEVGGRDTLEKALQALAYDAHIGLIGGLSGFAPAIPVGTLMNLGTQVSGVYVGSRVHFENLVDFIEEHEIVPAVDRVFSFEDAPEAFDFMENGSFFGKIVISH
ncbi:MAG TPA: NAD(P)-dependent alcohol dehydrogenase [Gammaproteobacteria bacterium]|jgi:NADPH:quinone reductase-like Zn-dependent oxidoreductase